MSSPAPHSLDRTALRRQLLAERTAWAATPAFANAERAVQAALRDLLAQLEPECLGVYWPLPGEFDPGPLAGAWALALPFAVPGQGMHYRRWDGAAPGLRDGCDIPSSAGAPVLPDVVLAPCVGFTAEGFRLGYGGGFFDRWLAEHPGVLAVGVAGANAQTAFGVLPHDRALGLVLTEAGVVVPG
jgi:5-formyltetrahydrofolate cyclo-ligase